MITTETAGERSRVLCGKIRFINKARLLYLKENRPFVL